MIFFLTAQSTGTNFHNIDRNKLPIVTDGRLWFIILFIYLFSLQQLLHSINDIFYLLMGYLSAIGTHGQLQKLLMVFYS